MGAKVSFHPSLTQGRAAAEGEGMWGTNFKARLGAQLLAVSLRLALHQGWQTIRPRPYKRQILWQDLLGKGTGKKIHIKVLNVNVKRSYSWNTDRHSVAPHPQKNLAELRKVQKWTNQMVKKLEYPFLQGKAKVFRASQQSEKEDLMGRQVEGIYDLELSLGIIWT